MPRVWTPHFAHALEQTEHFHGRKAELELLAAWLDDPRPTLRVMALRAIGGTGKTALTARAIDEWLSRRGTAQRPRPAGLFVWSFYENDRVDEFLGEACAYLAGEAGRVGGRIQRLMRELRGGEAHLLVLDGMERVQAEGGLGRTRGEIEDAGLRSLVKHVAADQLGECRILITTRFSVCDVQDSRYREIALDDLDVAAAREVLRALEVRGDDETLDRLAEKVHRHALSVRVMGAYLREFCSGAAKAGLGLNLGEVAEEFSEADRKARRLDGLIGHYARAMRDDERALMARLSLLPRGLNMALIAALAGAGGEVAGALAGRDPTRLSKLLESLVRQGIAFGHGAGAAREYTAHPFLRDAFRKLVDVPALAVQEALRTQLSSGLEEHPGAPAGDAATLDRYERLIEMTCVVGKMREAFRLYRWGLGGEQNLRHRLGEARRGARVLVSFSLSEGRGEMESPLTEQERGELLMDLGWYLHELGDLMRSMRFAEEAFVVSRSIRDAHYPVRGLLSVVGVLVSLGNLTRASRVADQALALARERYDDVMVRCCHAFFSRVQCLRGHFRSAVSHLVDAPKSFDVMFCGLLGTWEADIHRRVGGLAEARGRCRENLERCEQARWMPGAALTRVLLGQLALSSDLGESGRCLASIRDWVRQSGSVDLALRAHLLASELALATNDLDAAIHESAEGRALADAHSFGLHAIDLRVALARAHLARHAFADALTQSHEALARAADPECGYAWGEADALHVSGLAFRALGRHAAARARFRDAADLRARIEHPGAAESLAFATELTETTPLPQDPMTIFSPAQALQFQSAILGAFPSVSSLEQAVYFGLGARLAAVVDPGSLTTQVHSLLKWAAAEGRERELLTALRAANKGNPELRAFEDSVNAPPPVPAPVSPTPPPVIAPSPDVSPVASPRMATPWFRQLPIDWTRPEPRSVREALLAAYSSNPELLALAKSAGLKVSSLKHQMSAPALLVDEMLERARVADRLEQLLVEVFLNDEAAAVHAVLRDTLRGWEAVFHAAAVRRLPSLDVLSRIAPDLALQAPDAPGSFETLLNAASGFSDPAVFRRQLAAAEARVALVHVRGNPMGTGFLVGDRYLLTNWHVVQSLDGAPGADGVALFDHKRIADGVLVQQGRAVAFASSWLLARSAPADAAIERSPDGPSLATLDYALVELADPVGAEGIGANRDGEPRKSFTLRAAPRPFAADEPLFILGHPLARPLQLSYASPARAVVTPSGARVRYGTNTDGGSSGSPVLDRAFDLVALHHHGGPANNQGVPAERIAADLRAKLAGHPALAALAL